MSPKFEAAIFDMDGLLLDTERLALEAFLGTLTAFGLEPDHEIFRRMIGRDASVTRALLKEKLRDDATCERFSQSWSERYARSLAEDVPAKPDAHAVLSTLCRIDLSCGVATSTVTDVAEHKLQRSDLRSFFQIVIGGDQVSNGKPFPDIYLKAAAALGATPQHCVAFEDSENGVRAAHAAGMTVVQVPDLVEPSEELKALAHPIAATLSEGLAMVGLGETSA